MISTIFWDNDGVLVDTEHLYMEAGREVLAERGITLTDAQYVELFLRQNRGMLHFADEHGWSHEDLQALRTRRDGVYAALLSRESRVIDGVADTLAALHGRVRMAIVTSSRRSHFDIIHASSGLLQYFDFVLAEGDYVASKPHPAPYLAAIDRAGVNPGQCLVIEDSERGLTSALAAGVRCAIVPSRLTRGARFEGACCVLDDVRDVPQIIETLQGTASYGP